MKREYLSASALNAFNKSPNHYLAYVAREIEPTPAMIFGSALHCAVLESSEFDSRYAVAPKVDRRTKAGKEEWSEFQSANEGKEIISAQDMEQIARLYNRIHEEETAADLLNRSISFEEMKEGTIQGFKFKGIADARGEGFIVDLKTTTDSSPEKFARSAHSFGYHLQAAAYRSLFGVEDFFWIAIEKDSPSNVMVYRQSDRAKRMSDEYLRNSIDRFKAWDGSPGSYGSGMMDLDLPAWA